MERAGQMEIFRNGNGFQRDSTFFVATGWNGNFRFIVSKFPFLKSSGAQLLEPSRSTKVIASFSSAWKKPFPFDRENFRDFNPKILAEWNAPRMWPYIKELKQLRRQRQRKRHSEFIKFGRTLQELNL